MTKAKSRSKPPVFKAAAHEKASGKASAEAALPPAGDPRASSTPPLVIATRTDLIRVRHDQMKKEIDQIREDLAAEEDEE